MARHRERTYHVSFTRTVGLERPVSLTPMCVQTVGGSQNICSGFDPGPSCCEVIVLTAPLCCLSSNLALRLSED